LDAVGKAPEEDLKLDGVSLLPLLRGEQLAGRTLFWDYPHYGNQGGAPGSAVREGKWKLIEWREDDSLELYDLEADPSEKHNLAVKHPEVAERLHAKLTKWREEIGAKSPTQNPKYEARKSAA
jgi:arylsulfatase A-like enzyme